ncbi:MAG: hypothetical protein HWN79_02220 [Candidatus Lokiarchaeota archaeon]|nr:hypothetical protein [Candidatus Lokiarchaeota archaeon]
MADISLFFLIIVLIGLLIIAGILIIKVIIAEIKNPSNEQIILFALLGIIILFLIPFILGLFQIL